MRILQYLVFAFSLAFAFVICVNCVFGTYGLTDIVNVNKSTEQIKANIDILKKISGTLSSMRNYYASDDFYLFEARKLSMYTTDDVVVQIDGYTKKGLSEEYGSFLAPARPSSHSTPRILYSIFGAGAFFSFLLFVALGGGTVRHERKANHFRTVRAHRSSSR